MAKELVRLSEAENVPENNKTRKPVAKKTFSLENYKKKIGAQDVPDKPMEWIRLNSAIEKATGLPGFPKGYVSIARGYTNTGKSTALCEAIVSAQKMGMFPIIFDTENNLGIKRLETMGFDWNGNYIIIDQEYLLENFGKKQDPKRNQASIEDMGKCIYFFLDQQDSGDLPFDLFFAIDSIGTLNCIRTINAEVKNDSDNNMWNAGATEKVFMNLLNNTLPNSRKVNKQYTNTLVAVQKIWYDSMNKVIKHKHGETFFFGSRLIYHFGGILTHGTQRVIATSKKRDVAYGIETKVNVAKNHVDGPLGGISMEGKIISTPHGFVFPDDIDDYKKKNILYFRNIFGEDVEAEDITNSFKKVVGDGEIDSFEDEMVERLDNTKETEE